MGELKTERDFGGESTCLLERLSIFRDVNPDEVAVGHILLFVI